MSKLAMIPQFAREQSVLLAGLMTALCMSMASGCAGQRMESPGRAWELVDTRAVAAPPASSKQPASNRVIHQRKAVWLDPHADREYYAQTPTAQAVVARRGELPPSQNLAAKSMDGQDPTGWSHREVVRSWGVPTRVLGDRWVYVTKDGGSCKTLRMRDGVVASVSNLCES